MKAAQAGLFEVEHDVDVRTIFPTFEIERSLSFDPTKRVSMKDMKAILTVLGFKVGGVRDHTGEVMVFPVGARSETGVLFEVVYPSGWTVTDDLSDTIASEGNRMRHVLDRNGYVRAILNCDLNGVPHLGTLCTRYSVWQGVDLGFAKVELENRDGVRSIVVDATAVDRTNSGAPIPVMHVDRRWLLAEKYPDLLSVEPKNRRAWLQKNAPDYLSDITFECGSDLWLNEHYPNWKDPTAYWPR